MRKLASAVGLLLLLGTSASGAPSQLDDITIADNGLKGTKDCKGGSATVAGNKNVVTLKNCASVSVSGNKNQVVLQGTRTLEVHGNQNNVKAGVVQSISTMGNKNTITYKLGPKKEKPKVSNLGNENTVKAE